MDGIYNAVNHLQMGEWRFYLFPPSRGQEIKSRLATISSNPLDFSWVEAITQRRVRHRAWLLRCCPAHACGAAHAPGMRKAQIMPEDVTLNLDEDAPIPPCPVEGHKWGGIVHKHDVTWIATWKNSISGQPSYVRIVFVAESLHSVVSHL